MANHRNRRKLPSDVYYTARNGGMYVRWDGRPEGQVYVTSDRAVAYGQDNDFGSDDPQAGMTTDGWFMTPFQGADGSCRRARIVEMAAKYGQ